MMQLLTLRNTLHIQTIRAGPHSEKKNFAGQKGNKTFIILDNNTPVAMTTKWTN